MKIFRFSVERLIITAKTTIIINFQNESSAQSSSNKESDFDTNRSKRFDFLLKQTEIFSHFMPGSSKLTPEKKAKAGRKKEKEKEEEEEEKHDTSIDPAE